MPFDPISGGISAGVGLLGGVLNLFGASAKAKAAKEAARVQQEAAARAGEGVMSTAAAGNRDIVSGADRASAGASVAAGQAAQGVYGQTDAANQKLDTANSFFDPYRDSGNQANTVLSNGLSEGGQFNHTPTAAEIQMDPGFAARLAEANRGQERSAAARGNSISGSALMDLSRFNQTEASNEYSKAFDRFRQNRSDSFGFANTVANRGMDASKAGADILGHQGDNLIGAGKYGGDKIYGAATYGGDKVFNAGLATSDNSNTAARANGDYITQGANANAAGIVGAANANASKFSGFTDGALAGASVYNMLSNPSKTTGTGGRL